MEWYHVLGMVLGNLAIIWPLWLWNRAESRTDNRRAEDWLKSHRELIAEIYKEGHEWRREMYAEQKDFHYRLLEIEKVRK